MLRVCWTAILSVTSCFPCAFPCAGAEYNVQVSPVNARIEWQLGGTVHTTHGTFQLKKGDLWFDPASGKMRGELVVDPATGESGNGIRDGRMRSSVLEVKKYPAIGWMPDSVLGKVNLQGASEVKIHGIFSIHGANHEITIPAKLVFEGADTVRATLQFEIPYVQWGMKDPSTLMLRVDKVVKLKVQAEGHMGRGL